jgi:hypothetical protein
MKPASPMRQIVGFRAARDHHVGVAVLDQARRVADRVRAVAHAVTTRGSAP